MRRGVKYIFSALDGAQTDVDFDLTPLRASDNNQLSVRRNCILTNPTADRDSGVTGRTSTKNRSDKISG